MFVAKSLMSATARLMALKGRMETVVSGLNTVAAPGGEMSRIAQWWGRYNADAGQRAAALPEARAIVSEELEKLERWWSARDVIPTIKALTDHADAIREAQVERATRKMSLSPDDREQIDLMTRSIVKQLLHEPIAALRDGRAADADSDAVRKLFRLSCA